jgi:hypothetical protein
MTKVRVTFVDAESGAPMGETKLDDDQLPDRITIDTVFTIGDQSYAVAAADPVEKRDFVRSRKLELHLSPIFAINPRDVHFTIPTVSDDFPPTGPLIAGSRDDYLAMLQDDWRQVEFVSRDHAAVVDAELAAIRQIFADDSGTKIHVRQNLPRRPLPDVSVTEVHGELAAEGFVRRAGATDDQGHEFVGVFAYSRGKHSVYGLAEEGLVRLLGVHLEPPTHTLTEAPLSGLARRRDLILVDWVRGAYIELA